MAITAGYKLKCLGANLLIASMDKIDRYVPRGLGVVRFQDFELKVKVGL